ncbi:MAG: sulfatase-like hydrolase/transferase, partial [Pirellulaceae bacterium]
MFRILMVSLITFANACVFAATATRPNIVIIMADDLGYRDVSCYGCIDFKTPHIDALAADGIRMTNGYVSHPYCSPSRAGLITGRYQQRFGHEHNPPYLEDDARIGIDAETRLLPDIFREHGYVTGLVGKWHLGAGQPFRPIERGFVEFYGFLGGGHHYFQVKPNGTNYDSPMWRNASPSDDQLTYLTDDLTREAQSFILRHNHQPFCLLLMYNAPHAPDHVTDEYMAMVNHIPHAGRKKYAALVRGVDSGVGRIRKLLDEYGLSKNTIFVFLSDNGGRAGVSDNRPLRGNKGWLHEGGIRVPMIIAWPDKIAPGTTYHHAVSAVDLLPTAMAAANIERPADVDGVDLLPYLNQTLHEPPHETLYWRVCGGEGFAVRNGDWKLVHDVGMSSPELYNLADDPAEDQDLSH